MHNISIIVPIYNSEKTICRCISSILSQQNIDVEIIIVNDGSTDSSIDCVKKSFKEDLNTKIIIIETNHIGVSNARNIGLSCAKGNYVFFVDADDTIEPNCCETAYSSAIKYDADCVFFGANLYSENPIPQWIVDCTNTKHAIFPKFSSKVLFGISGTKPFVWNQIIKRSVLIKHNIHFDTNLILGEDQCFQFTYLPYADNIVLLSDKLYNHYIYPTSATFLYDTNMEEKINLHLDVVSSILYNARKHSFAFQLKVCQWAIEFIYPDAISITNIKVNEKASKVFSKYQFFIYTLPKHLQQKFCEIGIIKQINNSIFYKIIRKLFYKY